MGKKSLLLLVSGVMILVSCSTNAGKETEFTNEGIFCDLPSCLYDADDKVVALDLPSISDDVEEEANVSSLFYGYPQVDQENVLLGMKAFWLAYDKVVRAEIVHSDSLDAFTEKAQDYMSHVYQKLVEESNLLLYYG